MRNAFLDESLTEYSTALFYEKHEEYGLSYQKIIAGATENYKFFVKIFSSIYDDLDESMNRSLDEYATEPEYVHCVYTKGVLMFDAIRQVMGDRQFFNTLKTYYKTYKFKNASTDKMIGLFCENGEVESILDNFLNGKVIIA